MPDKRPPLLILGASTRAAAQSARRAGFRPICADFFSDEDLYEVAEVLPLPIENYPADLVRAAQLAPPCPWMYTGAIENYPDVVSEISANRTLWGNSAEILVRVRDPEFVFRTLTAAKLPVPRIRTANNPPPPDGSWMLKPQRSGGGRGITLWNQRNLKSRTLREPHWFQERIEGNSMSALFVACEGSSALVGVSRQWVGRHDFGASAHGYCGTIGPVDLDAALRTEIVNLGSALSAAAGLRGIFGVDFVLNDKGAWPVDVNPRYTASVEILERAYDLQIISLHARACQSSAGNSFCEELNQQLPRRPARYGAKAVLFAKRNLRTPQLVDLFPAAGEFPLDLPAIADRPAPGTLIAAGNPVCSVLAWGSSEEDCRGHLAQRVCQTDRRIYENEDTIFPGSS